MNRMKFWSKIQGIKEQGRLRDLTGTPFIELSRPSNTCNLKLSLHNIDCITNIHTVKELKLDVDKPQMKISAVLQT